MNNEKMNQIIDEAYKNYLENFYKLSDSKKWMKEIFYYDGSSNHHVYLKKEFINKIKTDSEFSEMWGLLIKETYDLIPHTEDFGDVIITKPKRKNKLIVVYKNEIIEVYD